MLPFRRGELGSILQRFLHQFFGFPLLIIIVTAHTRLSLRGTVNDSGGSTRGSISEPTLCWSGRKGSLAQHNEIKGTLKLCKRNYVNVTLGAVLHSIHVFNKLTAFGGATSIQNGKMQRMHKETLKILLIHTVIKHICSKYFPIYCISVFVEVTGKLINDFLM